MNRSTTLLVLGMLFSLTFVSALSVDLNVPDSFGLGEEIVFDYTIVSDTAMDIAYIVNVDCPNSPLPLLEIIEVSLQAGVPLQNDYVYMSKLTDLIEPQTCTASLGVIESEIFEQKNFTIATNPIFDFSIGLDKKVFVKGEETEIGFFSDVSPEVSAILNYPGGISEELSLPALVIFEETGTYTLEITATKTGYKTFTDEIQFAVIEEEVGIGYVSLADVEKEGGGGRILFYILYLLLVIGTVLVLVKLIKVIKKRKKRFAGRIFDPVKKIKKEFKVKEQKIVKKEKGVIENLEAGKSGISSLEKKKVDSKIMEEKSKLVTQKRKLGEQMIKKVKAEQKIVKKEKKELEGKEKRDKIKKLLAKGRRRLDAGDIKGAKTAYRTLRMTHRSLKPAEKNKTLYEDILRFHKRLTRDEKKTK